jgi:hypothetical protein
VDRGDQIMDAVCLVTITCHGQVTTCEIPWKLSIISLQECFLRIIKRPIQKKEAMVDKVNILDYWDEIFLQVFPYSRLSLSLSPSSSPLDSIRKEFFIHF